MHKRPFEPDAPAGTLLHHWWQELQSPGRSGQRAELRRCRSAGEVVMTATFQRLCQRLLELPEYADMQPDRLAAIVGLLAHTKQEASGSLAERMAQRKGDGVLVSELRFRRILQCDIDKLYPTLIRVLRLLDGKADIHDVAESVYFWGDGVKKRWAYNYFPRVPERKSA